MVQHNLNFKSNLLRVETLLVKLLTGWVSKFLINSERFCLQSFLIDPGIFRIEMPAGTSPAFLISCEVQDTGPLWTAVSVNSWSFQGK
jgi:hypothetical protein